MFGLPPTIVVFDTEYTSWEGAQARKWSGPNEYREIVQIGAVRVDASTSDFKEVDSLLLYVKPVKNPTLSEYFIDLTGITQETVDTKGMTLTEVVQKLYTWSAGDTCYSWGLDGKDIENNCNLIAIEFPFEEDRFKDARETFSARGIEVNNYMSSTIVEAFGVKNTGRGHDGLEDARTIVEALKLLAQQENHVG